MRKSTPLSFLPVVFVCVNFQIKMLLKPMPKRTDGTASKPRSLALSAQPLLLGNLISSCTHGHTSRLQLTKKHLRSMNLKLREREKNWTKGKEKARMLKKRREG